MNGEDIFVMKRLNGFKQAQYGWLGKEKEGNLTGGERRRLELTGRAVFIGVEGFFSVEEIDSECNEKKGKKECQIQNPFSSVDHLLEL